MAWKQVLFAAGYFIWFMVCAVALLIWQKRRKGRRTPFPEQTRLLRTAGETQLQLIHKYDEDLLIWVLLAAGVPVLIAAILLTVTALLPGALQRPWVIFSALMLVVAFVGGLRLFVGKARERSYRYLGYYGERLVAEHLDVLKATGWQVFHDIPCVNNGREFNIDHVAIGPQGVFVVETKTRRKGGAQPGFDDYKVFFDGRDLSWPWGKDSHGLEQAERNAVWLASMLRRDAGREVYAVPVLALPGWWVELRLGRESRLCRVVNAKNLPGFLSGGAVVLNLSEIDAISVLLDARCRDVEF